MSKQDFYEKERLEIKTFYRMLREGEKKMSRTEALNELKGRYGYSHSTLKQIMSNPNYRNLEVKKLETNNRAKNLQVSYSAA
jgi:hypothetical protein